MTAKRPRGPNTWNGITSHFTPAWFTVIMGTGSVSMLFNSFPYGTGSATLKIFSLILFFLNITLFVLFNILSLWRYLYFRYIWLEMIRHPVQSLYLGTYPMGFATIINVAVGVIYKEYKFGGTAFLYFVWACWWFDAVLSLLCGFVLVHVMMTRQHLQVQNMTLLWLLPPASLVVASSSGGALAACLQEINPSYALLTVTVSAIMVIAGLTIDFMLLTIYFHRLLIFGPPVSTNVLSAFVALGPTGQGGYSIMLIGEGYKSALPLPYGDSSFLRSPTTGETIYIICVCVALLMWAIATLWAFYAILAIEEIVTDARFPFSLPFWGLVFPNGVYANLTISLYTTFDSKFFRILGAVLAAITIALWLFVFLQTLPLVRDGSIFNSPDLEKVDNAHDVEKQEESRIDGTAC